MKRLAIIILLLAAVAQAYRIPVTATIGGGLEFDSIRIVVQRQASNSSTIANVEDTTINIGGTYLAYSIYVDSLYQHQVAIIYYVGTDTMREVGEQWPVQLAQYLQSYAARTLDSVNAANVKLDENVDSLHSQAWAATGSSSGGSCPDSGGYIVNIYAYDTISSAMVEDVTLRTGTTLASKLAYPISTGSGGYATYSFNSGKHYITAQAAGFTFALDSVTVTDNMTDTIFGASFVVSAPASIDLATVYGTVDCYDCNVRFTLDPNVSVADTSTGRLLSRRVYDLKTNSSGYFEQGLAKTENLLYQSGTQRKNPQWRIAISKTNVRTEPQWETSFLIPADSTQLNIGELLQ